MYFEHGPGCASLYFRSQAGRHSELFHQICGFIALRCAGLDEFVALYPISNMACGMSKAACTALRMAMERLAIELGVEIRLNTEVEEIQTQDGRATAIRLNDGEVLPADIVVSNMEVIPAMQKLLHSSKRRTEKNATLSSPVAPVWCCIWVWIASIRNWRITISFIQRHIRASISMRYFIAQRLSDDPTIYLVAPVKTDPAQAPEGCEIIKILAAHPAYQSRQTAQSGRLSGVARTGVNQAGTHGADRFT